MRRLTRCGMPLQILRKPDGSSRGFGFVTYSDEKAVEQCLVMQHEIGGKAVRTCPSISVTPPLLPHALLKAQL